MRRLLLITLVSCSLLATTLAAEKVSFSREIAPVLQKNCLTCHNAEKSKGGYRVDTFAQVISAGKSKEPALTSGEPEKSELYHRLVTPDADDRMPQDAEPLPAKEIELIRRWITEGGQLDKGGENKALSALIPAEDHPQAPEKYPFPVPVLAVAFDTTGQEIYVGGYNEVTVWNVATGQLQRRIPGVVQRVHGLYLQSERNEMLVVGGVPGQLGEAAMNSLGESSPRAVLIRSTDEMLGLAVSPEGAVLAIFGSDNAIHLFDSETRVKKLSIQQHADWVMGANFSLDGKRLVSASRDRTVRVYELSTGKLEATYMEHNAPVYAAAFTTDGKWVVSGGRGKSLHVWKVEDEKKVGEIGGFGGNIQELKVLGDSVLSACADGVVREHAIGERKLIRKLEGIGNPVFCLTVTRDGELLAAGSSAGEVRIWKRQTGEVISSFVARP